MTVEAVPQFRTALQKANATRLARATLKRQLAEGKDPVPLILAPPACIMGLEVQDLLVCLPRFGRARVHRLCLRCSVPPYRTVGALTERQRHALVEGLG